MERHRMLLERQRTERERRVDAKGTRWCQVIFTVNYLEKLS